MLKPELAKPDIRNTEELLAFHKAVFGSATMTAPNGEQPPATPPAEAPKQEPKQEEKQLSQSEVNRIAAREKDEGRQAALREVQEALGVDLDTAKQILKDHQEQLDSKKTEADKAREAADAEKAEAAKERELAKKETHDARVDRAFVAAGVQDEAKIARYSKLLDVEVGAKVEDIKAAVEKLKEEEPALFGAKADDPAKPKRTPAPSSDPKGTPPKPKQDEDAFSRGMARAQGHRSAFTAKVDKQSA